MLYHVSLLGVLVALMLFSLSINCEQHISLFIIHEHILTFLLADTCESLSNRLHLEALSAPKTEYKIHGHL